MLQGTQNCLFLFCYTFSTWWEQSNYGFWIIEILKYPRNCTEIWYYFDFFWTDRICSHFFFFLLNFAFDDLFSSLIKNLFWGISIVKANPWRRRKFSLIKRMSGLKLTSTPWFWPTPTQHLLIQIINRNTRKGVKYGQQ